MISPGGASFLHRRLQATWPTETETLKLGQPRGAASAPEPRSSAALGLVPFADLEFRQKSDLNRSSFGVILLLADFIVLINFGVLVRLDGF